MPLQSAQFSSTLSHPYEVDSVVAAVGGAVNDERADSVVGGAVNVERADSAVGGAVNDEALVINVEVPPSGPNIPTTPAQEWRLIRKAYLLIFLQYAWISCICLLVRKLRYVEGNIEPPPFWGWQGMLAGAMPVLVFALLHKLRYRKRIRFFLLVLQALSTSATAAIFHNTVFGDTLLLTAVQLTVMSGAVWVFSKTPKANAKPFSYYRPFFLGTSTGLCALLLVQSFLLAPTNWKHLLFCAMTSTFLNLNVLRETKKMLKKFQRHEGYLAGVHLYAFVARTFMGHISFMIFQME